MKIKFLFFIGIIVFLFSFFLIGYSFNRFYESYSYKTSTYFYTEFPIISNFLKGNVKEYNSRIDQIFFFILLIASIYFFIYSFKLIGENLIFKSGKTLGGTIKYFLMSTLLKGVTKYPLFTFIVRRFLSMIPIMLVVVFITIGLMELAPGDILTQFRFNPEIKEDVIKKLASQYGLDKPFIRKFLDWIKSVITKGDFGESLSYKRPVYELLADNLPHTIFLNFLSIFFIYALAIPLGVTAALNQFKWKDRTISFITFIFLSTPVYFFAIMLLYLVYWIKNGLGWKDFPIPIGSGTPYNWMDLSIFEKMKNYFFRMILPVLATSMGGIASFIRFMRGQMLEELNKLYITTARSKGLKRSLIVYKHALRNAVNPFVTNFGGIFASLLSGSLLTEIIFNFPGIGYILYQALQAEDLFLVMGNFILSAFLTLLGILISDILLTVVDPRIRIS
ncbi:MAG: ABC transporter permease [Spirochaetes bacterium]|nr:ABC transporter permease [Spirochaetota bacterium]